MGNAIRRAWRELLRRHVVSTAAAYAAAAFVLLQLAEILFPAFELEAGALRLLLAMLLAGFPVVVAISWVYDVTRSGLARTPPAEAPDGAPHPVHRPRPLLVAAVLVSAVAVGWVGWWAVQEVETASATALAESSIAVLPFVDMSPEGDQGYLGDGIAEEILNILSGVEGLHVAARTSAFAFRGSTEDVREIGQKLGVATLVEGSIRKSGDRVRVTAQLVDTRTGFHLWSDNFEGEMADLFTVQDDIAAAIVRELLGRLDLPERRGTRRVVSREAQDLYWQARAEWNRRDAVGIPSAITLFQKAVTVQPDYAEAYAGLADSYALLTVIVPTASARESLAQAQSWAEKAIELDSLLADPWASLGLVRALRQDRDGALEAFRRAIELNPSYAPALHWQANTEAEMGRLEPAAEHAAHAAELDPLSAAVATDHANILLWKGELKAARTEMERALSIDFGYEPALFGSVLISLEEGGTVPLRMALTQWAAVSGAPPVLAAQLTDAMLEFRRTGEPAEPPPALRALEAAQASLGSGTLAAISALVGARDETLRWLRASLSDGSWAEQYLAVNTAYDAFRDDPEFREILAEMHAPTI